MGHPNLSPEINARLAEAASKEEDREVVLLENLMPNQRVLIQTQNTTYVIDSKGVILETTSDKVPVGAICDGSTWGGSMLWLKHISTDMHLEFRKPGQGTWTTSLVRSWEIV